MTKFSTTYHVDHEIYGRYELIEMPGLDDTIDTSSKMVCEIAARFSKMYKDGKQLAGIVYLHRITDIRKGGSLSQYLRIFKELCGKSAYRRVVLVTSMSSEVDVFTGKKLEDELVGENGFYAELTMSGSPFWSWRTDDTPREVIDLLISKKQAHGPITLQIQRELVDEKKSLESTAAAQQVNRDLNNARERFEEEMQSLMDKEIIAMREQDIELQTILHEERKAIERLQNLIEDSQKAMQVTFKQLCDENKEKYHKEEITATANKYNALLPELGGKKKLEQNENRRQIQDAEEEIETTLQELEEKKREQSELTSLRLLLGHTIEQPQLS